MMIRNPVERTEKIPNERHKKYNSGENPLQSSVAKVEANRTMPRIREPNPKKWKAILSCQGTGSIMAKRNVKANIANVKTIPATVMFNRGSSQYPLPVFST